VAGTVIMWVNNQSVKSLGDLRQVVSGLKGSSGKIPLIVQEPDLSITRKVIRM